MHYEQISLEHAFDNMFNVSPFEFPIQPLWIFININPKNFAVAFGNVEFVKIKIKLLPSFLHFIITNNYLV